MKLALSRTYFVLLAVISLLVAGSGFSQTPGTGAIAGVLYDLAGRVVPK
jgi:hypothetical protein